MPELPDITVAMWRVPAANAEKRNNLATPQIPQIQPIPEEFTQPEPGEMDDEE